MTGLVLSLVVVLVVFAWLYLSVETVAAEIAPDDAAFRREIIHNERRKAVSISLILSTFLAVYWLIAGWLGRSELHRISSANCLLTLAFATFLAVLAIDHYGWIDTVCDVLPYPHAGFQMTKISECPSSSKFVNGLSSASMLLVGASLLVRIVVSRRRP